MMRLFLLALPFMAIAQGCAFQRDYATDPNCVLAAQATTLEFDCEAPGGLDCACVDVYTCAPWNAPTFHRNGSPTVYYAAEDAEAAACVRQYKED